jgi:hypothetical protein
VVIRNRCSGTATYCTDTTGTTAHSSASIITLPLLLLLPQIIAFCLYSAPLYYMCEKALRVHTKPIYIRVLARLPVCELTFLLYSL